jgi:hypothetical protein
MSTAANADELRAYFRLDRMPLVAPESYYDVVAQFVRRPAASWATFGVGYHRTLQELARVRARYVPSNRLFAFDWWQGLPEDWRPGYPRGHFRVPRETVVRWYAHDPSVVFVDGLFQDTLTSSQLDSMGALGLIHVDCDLYESARVVLQRLTLEPGCVVMFDEFYSPAGEWNWWEHEARAFFEVCSERGLEPWPLCRRAVSAGPLSEQAAFLIQ